MSETTFALPPAVAPRPAGPPRPDRWDAAAARLAGRLAVVVEELGDPNGARFLEGLADGVPAALSVHGDCLGLPSGGAREPIDRLVSALRPSPPELDLLVLAGLAHHHEGAAAVLRSLHPAGQPW